MEGPSSGHGGHNDDNRGWVPRHPKASVGAIRDQDRDP